MKIGLQAWGSEGDIRPFTALAAGLTTFGHDVTLVITDNAGRDYSGLAQRYGYKLKSLPSPNIPNQYEAARIWQAIIDVGNPIRQAEMIMTYGFDPVMENMYSAAKELCAENDLVIGHFFVFPLRVAAEKAKVPMATINIVHNCLPSRFICPPGLPDFGKWLYPLGWKLVRTMINRIFLPRVNKLRSQEGLTPDTDVMNQTWAAEKLNLLAVSRFICDRPDDWDVRHQMCGFLNPPHEDRREELPTGLEEFIAAGDSPVYFTFGSMMQSDLTLINKTFTIWQGSVTILGCRAIMQVPWDDLSVFGTNKKVFMVNRSPYSEVFPRCAAIVHHGGAGTTQSSLLAGKPSVVVAHMADQTFWGAELKRLGVAGDTLQRKSLSAQKLAKQISHVLNNPSMPEKANQIGKEMAQEDGVNNAIQLIERIFIGGGRINN
ncbi:MAG: glycosyltransferase [Desulfuromonadales bacterium]